MSGSSVFSRESDIKATIRLVKQIEMHPCLYDQNSREYSNRDLKRRAWIRIAKLNNCSVADAKMKWTKIRIAYIRTLRQSYQKNGKKTYYLAKYLKFIKPTKYINRCSATSENGDTIEQDEEVNNIQMDEKDELLSEYESEEHLDEQELDPQHEIYLESEVMNNDEFNDSEEVINDDGRTIDSKEVILNEINKRPEVGSHRNNNNHRNSENQINSESRYRVDNHLNTASHRNSRGMQRNPCCDNLECNPRKMFLFSLMPDIQKLSENQMRSFRRQVIQILDDIIMSK